MPSFSSGRTLGRQLGLLGEKNCCGSYAQGQPQQETWQGQIAVPMKRFAGDVQQIEQQRARQQTPAG